MFGKVDTWLEGGRDVQMSEIQKRFIKNRKMGLESGQRTPLPALSLFFDTVDERAENNSQNWQMKIVNNSIRHSISQHNCLRLSYIFRRGTGVFHLPLPIKYSPISIPLGTPWGWPVWTSKDLQNTELRHSVAHYPTSLAFLLPLLQNTSFQNVSLSKKK